MCLLYLKYHNIIKEQINLIACCCICGKTKEMSGQKKEFVHFIFVDVWSKIVVLVALSWRNDSSLVKK